LGIAGLLLLSIGCRQDMHDQPKYIPLRSSAFWADGMGSRVQVTGTVARGQLRADAYYYTGKNGVKEGDRFPFPITQAVLDRGQERYNIYCTPCHSRIGDGNGMIVQRGYAKAASLIGDSRIVQAPVGHYYDVITNGWGAMPDYKSQIAPADRWAVSAYIRVLQMSQNASMNDVPPEMRGRVLDEQQVKINGESLSNAELSGQGGLPGQSSGASATGPNPAPALGKQVEGQARQSAPQGGPKK
jgi:mono/diheme cytochrome c family protein